MQGIPLNLPIHPVDQTLIQSYNYQTKNYPTKGRNPMHRAMFTSMRQSDEKPKVTRELLLRVLA